MRSRVVLAGVVLASAAATLHTASASVPTTPRPGCALYTDPAGDTTVPGSASASDRTVNNPAYAAVAGRDITGVSYRLSDETFSTVLRVPGLSASDQDVYWTSTFTQGTHVVVIKAGRATTDGTTNTLASTRMALGTVTIDGTAANVLAGATFDVDRHLVSLSADRQSLEAALRAPLGTLTKLAAANQLATPAASLILDTATAPTNLVIDAGDNFCFV